MIFILIMNPDNARYIFLHQIKEWWLISSSLASSPPILFYRDPETDRTKIIITIFTKLLINYKSIFHPFPCLLVFLNFFAANIKSYLLKQRKIIARPQPIAIGKLVSHNPVPFFFRIPQKIDSGYTFVLMLEMIAQGNRSLTEGRYRPAEQVLKEFEERIEEDFSWCHIRFYCSKRP